MMTRVVGVLSVIAVVTGCGGSRIQTACDRACVGGERCDRPTKRCVQNEAPVISLETPARSALIGTAEVLVTGTITDDTELIKSAEVSLDQGGTWIGLGIGEGGRFEKRVPVPVQDGEVSELRLRAFDLDDFEGGLSVPMVFDRVAPRCRVVAPAEGVTLSGTTAALRVDVTDGSGRYGNGTLAVSASTTLQKPIEGGQVVFDVPLPAVDGVTQQWQFEGADAAGNRCQLARDVRIDTVGPVVTVSAPTSGSSVTRNASGVVPVRFALSDASALQGAEVQAPPSTVWQPAVLTGSSGAFDWQVPVNDQGVQRTVRVRATDAHGNVGAESTVTVAVDTVPPTCTLLAPMAGQLLSQSSGQIFQVRWSAQDGSGVLGGGEVSFDDGATWLPVSLDASGTATYPWTLDATANGVATTIRVRATDAAGNRCAERVVQVTVDTVGPTISVTAPALNSSLSTATVAFSGVANDGARAAMAVTLDFADGVGPRMAALNGSQWAVSVPTNATEDFVAHQVIVRATDTVGNSTSLTWPVRVDRVAPSLLVPQPTEGQRFNAQAFSSGDDVTAIVQSSDGDPFLVTEYRLGTAAFAALTGGQIPVTTSVMDDDVEYVATVRARDSANNVSTVIRRFRVDRRAPALTITSPASNAALNAAAIVFTGTTDAAAPTLTLDFADGTGPRAVTPSGGAWSLSVPTVNTEDFVLHAVVARAVDAAGNVTTVNLPVRVDRVAPRLTLPTPTEGQVFNASAFSTSSTVSLTTNTVDGDSTTVTEVETSPGVFSPVSAGAVQVATQPTDNDVAYSRTVRARDAAGNTTSVTRTFRVDRVVPTIAFTNPSAGASLNTSTILFTGTASDGASAIGSLTLDFADGVGPRTINALGSAWSLTVPTVATEDFVAHSVVLRGQDAAGNVATLTRALRVDRVAPVVIITAPTEGQRFNASQVNVFGVVTVAAQVTDGDPAIVVESFSGAAWVATGAGNSTTVTTAPTDNNVEYSQPMRARDTAGNIGSLTRRFRVDRVAPTVLATTPTNGQLGTPLEFALQFSEPMVLASGLPAAFVPAEPPAATVALDGPRRIATISGLAGNTAYQASLRPAGITDDFGNPPAATAPVTFTTAPRRPTNGAVLVDATPTRQVELFRISGDEDGVVSIVARLLNPQTGDRTWLFGWIDPVTGQFLQQGTTSAGTTGAFITSVSEPASGGTRRRRASVRLGLTGSSAVFELGAPGVQLFPSGVTFGVAPGTPELTGSEVSNVSLVGFDPQYSRPPNAVETFGSSFMSPQAVSVFDRNQWAVVLQDFSSTYRVVRTCTASACTMSAARQLVSATFFRDQDRMSYVQLNGITWFVGIQATGTGVATVTHASCVTNAGSGGAEGGFLAGWFATPVRSGPNSIDLAWMLNSGTYADLVNPVVRVSRITGCAPSPPGGFTTFPLTNATGSQIGLEGQVLPEVSPVPGPTAGLLWLEAPGRLRYTQ